MLLLLDIISGVLLLAGVFFGLSGAVGVFKLSNFFTRVHDASVTDSIAVILIIGGLLLQTPLGINIAKLLFILGFLLITSPTASHALAKSARHGGLLPMSELEKADQEEKTAK